MDTKKLENKMNDVKDTPSEPSVSAFKSFIPMTMEEVNQIKDRLSVRNLSSVINQLINDFDIDSRVDRSNLMLLCRYIVEMEAVFDDLETVISQLHHEMEKAEII